MKKIRFHIGDDFGQFRRYIIIEYEGERKEAFRIAHQEMKCDEFIIDFEELA